MEYYGYIYKTTNLLDPTRFYIGRKAYLHRKKRKLTKKELSQITKKGRKPTYKVEYIDSGYRDYFGSSKELLEDILKLGKENFQVEILKECKTKKSLSYWEVFFQFKFDVLNNNTYNHNIMGVFFRKDL